MTKVSHVLCGGSSEGLVSATLSGPSGSVSDLHSKHLRGPLRVRREVERVYMSTRWVSIT